MIVHDIGSVLLVICAVMAISFCVLYHFSAVWWSSEEGKHLMSFTGSIAAILTMYTIKIVSDTHAQWFEILRLVIFTSFPFVLAWRLSMLFRFQINPRRQRKKKERGWSATNSSRQTQTSQFPPRPPESPRTRD